MTEVKNTLLERIKSINNQDFLEDLLVLVQNMDDDGIYKLSDQQKSEIDASILEIENGNFVSHEEVMKKYRK